MTARRFLIISVHFMPIEVYMATSLKEVYRSISPQLTSVSKPLTITAWLQILIHMISLVVMMRVSQYVALNLMQLI